MEAEAGGEDARTNTAVALGSRLFKGRRQGVGMDLAQAAGVLRVQEVSIEAGISQEEVDAG